MNGTKHLAVGLACGVALTGGAMALIGTGPAPQPADAGPKGQPSPLVLKQPAQIVGVTGFTTAAGVNGAIAWELDKSGALVPVAHGLDMRSHSDIFGTMQANMASFAKGDDVGTLNKALQAAGSAKDDAERKEHYAEAARIIQKSCPGCYAEYEKCTGSPTECFGRLVACVLTNCH